MCGIAGVLGGEIAPQTILRMTRALSHRGPDDEGVWVDPEAAIGFGHRRLSIIDVSAAGHQPMQSAGGRFVITFNGEIYNYPDLRAELEAQGHQVAWRGHSDTEILLAGFDFWGVRSTLERAKGMFALALWDKKDRTLILARDRLGEKPLYYGRQNGVSSPFLFGSELKGLTQHPGFSQEIDREALDLYVRHLAVPAPLSIYRGISKLLPGTMLTVAAGSDPRVEEYWSGAEVARSGVAAPLALSPEAATDELEALLERVVGRQMISDVPLGAFLSGGVDSSTVVAIMQKLSSRPVKTFTVGFHDEAFNEAPHAKAVADHLGTDHNELYVSGQQAMDVIPRLPEMYDEPFADSSQIPTHLISALARTEVTVALSGDGGDEMFGGYDRYMFAARLWKKVAGIPGPIRSVAGQVMSRIPAGAWTALGDSGRLLPDALRVRRLGEKVQKVAPLLSAPSLDSFYDGVVSAWPREAQLIVDCPAVSRNRSPPDDFRGLGDVERMMLRDMLGYLSDDVLAKVDRAAMAVSLETRVPLLDPEVVAFAWRLPLDLKIRGGTSKWILRQALYRHVPKELIERPKTGFGVPLDDWLRGPLRDWAAALLDPRRLQGEGFFNAPVISGAWNGQLKGQANASRLWTILMFQSWLDATRSTAPSEDVHPAAVAG